MKTKDIIRKTCFIDGAKNKYSYVAVSDFAIYTSFICSSKYASKLCVLYVA